jgi:hypothetical protein
MDADAQTIERPSFSWICTGLCRGICCDPWWGIISYSMVKRGGLPGLKDFRPEVLEGINARARRIADAYVTNEEPGRRLFGRPERYNVRVTEVNDRGAGIEIKLLAIFAFRCALLSEDKTCAAHPSLLDGREVRPPHCLDLGSPEARPGEKGFCRVIHAAPGGRPGIEKAIEVERAAAMRHYDEGCMTAEEAAESVIRGLKEFRSRRAPDPVPAQKGATPGRNEPCLCGSGLKYKKCHGR